MVLRPTLFCPFLWVPGRRRKELEITVLPVNYKALLYLYVNTKMYTNCNTLNTDMAVMHQKYT